MRILHFYKTSLPTSVGGVEEVIHELSSGAAKSGHAVSVLSLGQTDRHDAVDGYEVYQCRSNFEVASTPFSVSVLATFKRLAASSDIINYHYPWPFMDLVHFASRVNKPTVVTYHSDIVRQETAAKFYAPLRDMFLGSIDAIVATSPNYCSTSTTLKRHLDRVVVIPIGIDGSSTTPPSDAAVDYWRCHFGDRFYLFIGVLRYYKGLHLLLEAAAGTEVPVVIVGSGPTERELFAQAERMQLGNVHFLGRVSNEDKAALLRLCFGVLFPSHLRAEAFGVSLLEGAMYGKPLISSEIGTGTSYVNIDQQTGLVVPPNDAGALRKAMLHLWERPQLAEAMGARAAERYRAIFTADRMVRDYIALYENLIERRRRLRQQRVSSQ